MPHNPKLHDNWKMTRKAVLKSFAGRSDGGREILSTSMAVFVGTLRDAEKADDPLGAVVVQVMTGVVEAADECHTDILMVLQYTVQGIIKGAVSAGIDLEKTASIVMYTAVKILAERNVNEIEAIREIAAAIIVGTLGHGMEAVDSVRRAVGTVLSKVA